MILLRDFDSLDLLNIIFAKNMMLKLNIPSSTA